MLSRLGSNSWSSSCLSFPSAGIINLSHLADPCLCLWLTELGMARHGGTYVVQVGCRHTEFQASLGYSKTISKEGKREGSKEGRKIIWNWFGCRLKVLWQWFCLFVHYFEESLLFKHCIYDRVRVWVRKEYHSVIKELRRKSFSGLPLGHSISKEDKHPLGFEVSF